MLSEAQIEAFKKEGFVKVESAIDRKDALAVQDFIWEKLEYYENIQKDDPATWAQEIVHIQEDYSNAILDACSTLKLNAAVNQLIAPNEWKHANERVLWGWWPVNFSYGAREDWTIPHEGWHWDGLKVTHSLTSPNLGLLLICLFSDVEHKGGATALAAGSHRLALDFLKDYPDGLDHLSAVKGCINQYDWLRKLASDSCATPEQRNAYFFDSAITFEGIELQVREATGQAGDVYLCHPYLFHAAAYNHRAEPRFMCNRTTPLKRSHTVENNPNPSVLEDIAISILESGFDKERRRYVGN